MHCSDRCYTCSAIVIHKCLSVPHMWSVCPPHIVLPLWHLRQRSLWHTSWQTRIKWLASIFTEQWRLLNDSDNKNSMSCLWYGKRNSIHAAQLTWQGYNKLGLVYGSLPQSHFVCDRKVTGYFWPRKVESAAIMQIASIPVQNSSVSFPKCNRAMFGQWTSRGLCWCNSGISINCGSVCGHL